VVLVGLQGSGKSTFFTERLAATHAHVSKDLMRHAHNRERRQQELVTAALAEGRSIVVDNTNLTPELRKALIEIGHGAGVPVVAYYFKAKLGSCLERNRTRIGRARVPDWVIAVASRRLKPPTPEEGFDAIFQVNLGLDGAFEVTPVWEAPGPGAQE